MLSSSAMPASRFIEAYDELLKYDGKTKCSGIEREFRVFSFIIIHHILHPVGLILNVFFCTGHIKIYDILNKVTSKGFTRRQG